MKSILFTFAAILLGVSANAAGISSARYSSVTNQEKPGQFGVGLELGSMTGLSTQYWLENDRAINATFAAEGGNAALSVSHLWLFREAFVGAGRQANYFVPYIGVGAIVAFGTQSDYFSRDNQNTAVAAQVPLGFEFLPALQRFDIFAELAPSFEIAPITSGFLTADVGVRFYF